MTVSPGVCIRFAKTGDMRFISHLDLMRLFQRALRRAGIPVEITKGFSPHPRISIEPAIKLGLESRDLKAVFKLDDWVEPSQLKDRLQKKFPPGIELLEVRIQ